MVQQNSLLLKYTFFSMCMFHVVTEWVNVPSVISTGGPSICLMMMIFTRSLSRNDLMVVFHPLLVFLQVYCPVFVFYVVYNIREFFYIVKIMC